MANLLNFVNIAMWNIRGLFDKINNVKVCKLDDQEILKRIQTFEIFCIQETQCGINEAKSIKVPGYCLYPYQRKISKNNRHFGGSLILIRNELRAGVKIIESKIADIIWIKLLKSFFNLENDVYFCSAYVPPLRSCYTQSLDYDIIQNLEEDIARFRLDGNVIIGGDFNARDGHS